MKSNNTVDGRIMSNPAAAKEKNQVYEVQIWATGMEERVVEVRIQCHITWFVSMNIYDNIYIYIYIYISTIYDLHL